MNHDAPMDEYEKKRQQEKIKLLMDALRVVRNRKNLRNFYRIASHAEAKSHLYKALTTL